MGIFDAVKRFFGIETKEKQESRLEVMEDIEHPLDLQRTIFLRSSDTDMIINRLNQFMEGTEGLKGNATVYKPDQGWTPIALSRDVHSYHFLIMVPWFARCMDGTIKEDIFKKSIGWSKSNGKDPFFSIAFQTDPQSDGEMIIGVTENGSWIGVDLLRGNPILQPKPLFQVDGRHAIASFLRERFIPERMWGDPGYWRYLPVALDIELKI